MTPVQAERDALCDTLLATGPDAPTLCEGWSVLDLAAHLVVRENRPDAAAGLVVPALAPRLERITQGYREQGLPALVARLRAGPPAWSPARLPAVDAQANLAELVVHHEDVRRAAGMGPREGIDAVSDAVWRSMRASTLLARRGSRVPVVAVSLDGRRQVLRAGAHPVVLTGTPVDILLRLFGRGAAQVELGGPSLTIGRFLASPQGI